MPVGAEHGADRGAAGVGRMGFRDLPGDGQQAQAGEDHQHHEQRTPAGQQDQVATDQRGDQGGEHGHQVHQRQHSRGVLEREQVADDGARQYRSAGAAESLKDAPEHQLLGLGGEGATDAGEHVQGDAAEQQLAPAEAVGQRTVDQHAGAQAGEEHADGQLDLRFRSAEVLGDQRQAWQVHVDRQRAEGHQRGQQDDQALGIGYGGGHAISIRVPGCVHL
ncbi:hypothetical protein D3C75_821660 [compost metagenome]